MAHRPALSPTPPWLTTLHPNLLLLLLPPPLLQGVYAVTFFKDANTTPAFRAYLLAHVAAVLACAAGRTPRRREVLAAALRLATFVIPAWAHHGLRKLDQPPPELSSPALQALAFAGVLLLTSGTLSAFGLALSRRVRLWGQVVLQAVTMAVILPHADEMCRTATLRQAAVGEQLAGVYRFMEALALLTPVSGVMELHHSAHGRCRCACMWRVGRGGGKHAGGRRPCLCLLLPPSFSCRALRCPP